MLEELLNTLQKRLGIASVLSNEAIILLAGEPLGYLDRVLKNNKRVVLKQTTDFISMIYSH